MDQILEVIMDVFQRAIERIIDILVTVIIDTVVELLGNVIDYFKELKLSKKLQTAFIMKTNPKKQNPISKLIPEELRGQGVLEGVYNKGTETLDSIRYIGGNGVSKEVNDFIGDDDIIALV